MYTCTCTIKFQNHIKSIILPTSLSSTILISLFKPIDVAVGKKTLFFSNAYIQYNTVKACIDGTSLPLIHSFFTSIWTTNVKVCILHVNGSM